MRDNKVVEDLKYFGWSLAYMPELPKKDGGKWGEIEYSLHASSRTNFDSILDALTDGLMVTAHINYESDEGEEYFKCEFEDGWGKWRKS